MRKMFLPKNKRGEGSNDNNGGGGAANSVTTKIETVHSSEGISVEGNERATSISNNGSIRYE